MRIAGGHVDFDPNLGRLSGRNARDLLVNRRVQVHIHPALGTSFLFLNTKAPPFTQVGVRRALNLAYDRSAAVDGWGERSPRSPPASCSARDSGIPPTLPDTSHPSDDGRWKGTDLARAKRLVAASGTRGMRVVVWNVNPSSSGSIEESRLAVTALRRLGYRASLRLLPESTYFTYIADSRNRAQVIDGGFSADYASASVSAARPRSPPPEPNPAGRPSIATGSLHTPAEKFTSLPGALEAPQPLITLCTRAAIGSPGSRPSSVIIGTSVAPNAQMPPAIPRCRKLPPACDDTTRAIRRHAGCVVRGSCLNCDAGTQLGSLRHRV